MRVDWRNAGTFAAVGLLVVLVAAIGASSGCGSSPAYRGLVEKLRLRGTGKQLGGNAFTADAQLGQGRLAAELS